MNRSKFFRSSRRRTPDRYLCECGEVQLAHWGQTGRCVVPESRCLKFRPAKDQNKYHAVKTLIKGVHYDSKFEGKVGADLAYQLTAGEIKDIRRQVDFPLVVMGRKICTYRADFLVTHLDNSLEVVEAKGLKFPEFRIKWALMEVLHPELKLTMVRERSL